MYSAGSWLLAQRRALAGDRSSASRRRGGAGAQPGAPTDAV